MTPLEIVLPEQLYNLIKYCERNCVAECCGIDAFDFSPLLIASYASIFTCGALEAEIAEWERLLTETEELTRDLTPDNHGYICSIAGVNQCFTSDSLNEFIGELRYNMRTSLKVLELSEQLRYAKA
jgi:hypothetical protein